jgi:hypothetical protein
MEEHIIHADEQYVPDVNGDIVEEVPQDRRNVMVTDAPVDRSIAYYRTTQIVWFLLGTIETLLVFRFVLKMIGASTISGFTDFIYTLSYPFAAPFVGILPASVSGSSIIEWSTLIAMVVYLVFAYGVLEIIRLLIPIHSHETGYSTRRTRYAV